MTFAVCILGIILLLAVKYQMDKKNLKRKMYYQLKKEWGQISDQEYTSEKLDSIAKYYESQKEPDKDIDDITWNDLNMERIFMLINHTESSIGEEYLYSMLRKIQYDDDKLKERNRLITFFSEAEEKRRAVQMQLKRMGKLPSISFFEYINRVDAMEAHKPYLDVLCLFLFPLSIASAAIPVTQPYAIAIMAFVIFFNTLTYYRRKAKIEIFFNVLSYILRCLSLAEELSALNITEIDGYLKDLKKELKTFRSFERGSYLVTSRKAAGSIEDMILDYIRMLFHVDLIKFDSMVRELHDKKEDLNHIFEIVGLLDSAIAAASFRAFLQGQYSIPKLSKGSRIEFSVKDVYHPLIPEPVKNSITAKGGVLLTGSNASGKSTFIKTLAINAILSQTIYTSPSAAYRGSYFAIYSSMALRDDIMSQESYYIVEIKSLKRIYDATGKKIPALCFVDEVLRGTNTAERIAASAQILKSLSLRNCLCFAATHDIELTYILEKYYNNYHFQEKIENNQVLFDYLLYEGRAVSRNAIKLLSMMGYSKEIIENAAKAVEHFMQTNTWKPL